MVLIVSDAIANITPVTPPNKFGMKANENSIGDSNVIRPLYNVNNQLNNLTRLVHRLTLLRLRRMS